ncbi:BBE domain-containing protein [Rhizobium sp. CFBP 8762]|nr:BBE domain-containing protein [Rhizobium sp. CFBP 8762]
MAYQNFPDPALNPDEWRSKYYDRNLGRLQQAKYQFDRYDVFSHPQSII